MQVKIKRILSSALCVLMLGSVCYADSVNVTYDPLTELINVNGSFDDTSISEAYVLEVRSLSDNSAVYTAVEYAENGKFDFSLMLGGVSSDEYYVSVMPYSGGGADSKDKPIFVSSAEQKDDILKNVLSNQTDKTVMAKFLNDNLKYFGLNADNCDYFKLSASSAERCAERLLNKSFSYEKYGEFLNDLNLSIGIEMLDNADDSNVSGIFEKYIKYFGLENEACYPIYSGSDKNVKNQSAVKAMAVKSFVGKDITDISAVRKYFNENLLLAAISNVSSPGEIITHIDNYKSVIPFSTDTYDASDKSETAVYIANLKRNYTLMQTLKDDIDSAYGAQTNGGGNGGNGGSSSSSGSKGGSSNGFFSPGANTAQPEQKGSFNDLPSTHWAYEVIEGLKAKGIVSGDEKGNFNPENSITREEFAKILVCAFGFYDENAECSFADASGHWSYKYVASLYKMGITNGIDERNFGVGLKITREDMATMCAKASKLESVSGEISFADGSDISDYALAYVASLVKNGAVKGFEDNTFRPKNNASRAEASAVIYNLIK